MSRQRAARRLHSGTMVLFGTAAGLLGLAGSLLAAPAADAAPTLAAKRLGTVTAQLCANLGVTVPLNPDQARRAQATLPAGFTLAATPTLLVETSTCASATVNGTRIGRFYLSESALSIEPPRTARSPRMDELVAENIYMLSQLDTDAVLSEFKADAGYATEITDITLDLGDPNAFGRRASATAGGTLAPTKAVADLTPSLLPDAVRVPNPGIVYKLWTRDQQGRFVVTTNANMTINRPAAGVGTVTVRPGTLVHRILGGTAAQGVAFSGQAERFVNDTFVFPR